MMVETEWCFCLSIKLNSLGVLDDIGAFKHFRSKQKPMKPVKVKIDYLLMFEKERGKI